MKRETGDIRSVVRRGLCIGCGTCVALCPRSAICMQLDRQRALYVPVLVEDACNSCGMCLRVCPGHAVDFSALSETVFGARLPDSLLGHYVGAFTGHAADPGIRYAASSGGLVSALLIHALEQGIINGALVSRMQSDNPLEPQPFIARTREEILSACGSKYCPVPANTALSQILQAKDSDKFAVVGLPCHLQGLRKAEMVNAKLRERVTLHMGIVCSHTASFSLTRRLLEEKGVKKGDVARLDYRGDGWPGNMRISLSNGKVKSIPYTEYITRHGLYMFAPRRCTQCVDFIGRLADICFMDAWLPEIRAADKIGTSIAIARTTAACDLLYQAQQAGEISIEAIPAGDVLRSQGRQRLSNRDALAHARITRVFGIRQPVYDLRLPRPGALNYLRAVVIQLNIFISARGYLKWMVSPLARIQSIVFKSGRNVL